MATGSSEPPNYIFTTVIAVADLGIKGGPALIFFK